MGSPAFAIFHPLRRIDMPASRLPSPRKAPAYYVRHFQPTAQVLGLLLPAPVPVPFRRILRSHATFAAIFLWRTSMLALFSAMCPNDSNGSSAACDLFKRLELKSRVSRPIASLRRRHLRRSAPQLRMPLLRHSLPMLAMNRHNVACMLKFPSPLCSPSAAY